jgi:glycosyltransferase involved in cell wall biosynthesis
MVFSGGNSNDPHDFGGSIASFRRELNRRGLENCGFDALNGWKNFLSKLLWVLLRIFTLHKPYGWQFSSGAMTLYSRMISKLMNSQDILLSFYQITPCRNYRYIQIVDSSLRYLFESYAELARIPSDVVSKALLLEKESYRFAEIVFVPNNEVRNDLIINYQVTDSKIVVAPWSPNNVSELSHFEIVEKKCESIASGIQFLFIGKDFARKRLDKAVFLVKRIIEAGIQAHLHVVGGDGSNTPFRSESFITFHGFLPNNSIALLKLLEISHVGLLFSDGEATGISLLEFQKAGLVTITSGKGGTSSYLFTKYCFIDSSEELSCAAEFILNLDIKRKTKDIYSKSIEEGSLFSGFDSMVDSLIGLLGLNQSSKQERK